jgi:predicted nucleic acid-binding protein
VILFVDTSAVVALLSAADEHHADAVAVWKEIVAEGPQLVTTDLVLAEAVVVVRARAGFDLSVRAGERLLADPFEIVWVDRALLDDAWRLYRRYRDHDLSLCDCVSFAVMRRRRIDTAFAYDRDFEAVGFSQARPVGESRRRFARATPPRRPPARGGAVRGTAAPPLIIPRDGRAVPSVDDIQHC